MLTFTSPQQAVVDAENKEYSWLFELTLVGAPTPLYWSTTAITWGGHDYVFKVQPASFAGVRMVRARVEGGIRNPATVNFSAIYGGTDYQAVIDSTVGAVLVVRKVINGVQVMAWKFKVKTCTFKVGALEIMADDFLQAYLDGDYPNTPLISDLDPSFNRDLSDPNSQPDTVTCVPVTFGTAFMPLELILSGGERYYILGQVGATYTVSEVRSPKTWNSKSQWSAAEFTMTVGSITIDGADYATLRPIIAPSIAGGTVIDAMGFWPVGDGYLAMPTEYSSSATATLTNPADCIEQFFLDIGVPSGDIDAPSFAAAAPIFTARGIAFNGGWNRRQSRQLVLASLLIQCGGSIDVRDKIYLRALSKVPVATITDADILYIKDGPTTFRYTPAAVNANDSGYISLSLADTPADVTTTILVSASDSQANPISQTLSLPLIHDSIIAQKLGRLYYQRALMEMARPTWQNRLAGLGIQPDDILTIDHDNYGGTYSVLVDEVSIERTGQITIHAIRYSVPIEEFGDFVGFTEVTPPVHDQTGGFRLDESQMIAAAAAVDVMTADGKLSTVELQQIRVGWEAFAADKVGLDNQAAGLGLTTAKAAYDMAFVELATYLNAGVEWVSGVPSWISDATLASGVAIDIVRATFRSQLAAYDTARSTLLTAIVDASANSIRLSLTNSAHVIPCAADGTPTSFSGATTTATVYRGAADDSANWTFNAVKTNVTASEAATSRTQTVTGISADVGYIDITASRSGYASVTGRFSLSKAKAGTNGTDGTDGNDGLDGADGAALIRAGFGADYRLRVNETAGGNAVLFYHKDATPGVNLGAGYSGTLRTGLYLSANGIGIGYHDMATGAWVDSILLNGSTGSAMLDGNLDTGGYIYATGRHDGGGFYACITGIPDNTNDLGGYYFNPDHTALRADTLTGTALHATATTGTAINATVGAGVAVHGAASGSGGMGGYFTASAGAKAAVFYGGAVDFGSCTIMTSTTAKVTNLHADYLDGYDAGNGSYQLPINNGTLNAGLNADFLDGSHASAFAGVSHTHWLTSIYNDTTGGYKAKFKYSTDGINWTNIWLWRNDW